jgi:aryl-alcohol dehydrogenase-like predicted oxidoreductase
MTPTALRTAELGATGLKITRVGFGAWRLEAVATRGAGDRRMTRTRSRRSTTRWRSG